MNHRRYYSQDVFDNYYTELAGLEKNIMTLNDVASKIIAFPTNYILTMDLFTPKINIMGYEVGDRVGGEVEGVLIDKYQSIVFLCLDIYRLFYSYSVVEKSILFRKYYRWSSVVRCEARRELCVDNIFTELRRCYSNCKKIVNSLNSKYFLGEKTTQLFSCEKNICFLSSPLYPKVVACRDISNKIASILFYSDFVLLKILLHKFDYVIVECISTYLIDSEKYICFHKIHKQLWG